MAGPGDEITAGAAGHGRLRASHADREQVIGTLKAAFVQGMLARDEFDQRVSQTFAARTCADLATVTADLPAGRAADQPPTPARAPGKARVVRHGKVITVATALYIGVWPFLVLWPTNSSVVDPPAPPGLLPAATLIYLFVLVVAVGRAIAGRREKRSGRQLPRGPAPGACGTASWRPPPAGPGGQLPPANPSHRHTAKAARTLRPRPSLPGRGHCAGGALVAGTASARG
jgi:Domain of unknown function (DUF1707)